METPLSSNVLRILSDGYLFFRDHFQQIAALCLPFIFGATLLNFVLASSYHESPMSLFGPLMVNLMAYPLYTAALVHLMARRIRQEQPKNGDLLIAAVGCYAPFLVLKIMLMLIIGLGLTLLIIPGIYLAVRLAYAEFHVVLFNHPPFEAIRRSLRDTRSHFFLLWILLVVTYIPITLMSILSDQVIQNLSTNDFFRLIASTGWSFAGLYVTIVIFRAFTVTSESRASEPPPRLAGMDQ